MKLIVLFIRYNSCEFITLLFTRRLMCVSGNHSRISSTNVPESTHISLSILGVQPVIPQLKRMSFFGDKKEAQKSATALGYVAHVCSLLMFLCSFSLH